MKYEIRNLRQDDLRMGSGFFETLMNLTKVKAVAAERLVELFLIHESQKIVTLVADTEQYGIISTARMLFEPKFTRGGSFVGHIEDVVTRKNHEKNGIASELVKKLIELAKEKGCYKIILDCDVKNITFYEKFGLTQDERQMRIDI